MRYVVIYYDGNDLKAKIIIDHDCSFPFGVTNEMVADDCYDINAIISIGSYEPCVVINDEAVIGE